MTALSTGVIGAIKSIFTNAIPRRHLSSAASLVDSLTTDESIRRKRLNLFMKFVDLFIQTVMLLQILENGVPIVLVAVVTVIVAANAVGCALVMLLPFEQTALVENVVDLIFDLLIAVGYPVIVLTNRNLQVLPEEIRGCTEMRYMSLMYTHTQTFPSWIKELKQLEYLHVEGKATIGLSPWR
ncbi:hypothetical protein PC114_g13264 [Phytophthora cactorum]|nr:hypothetical protein PC114_g13264 [Phytophthora cactorum]KAG3080183.1 hypothetical protein PC122_g11883 [Phytophthora cactorum]